MKKGIGIGSQGMKIAVDKAVEESAIKIADQSLSALLRKDYDTAIGILEAAQSINPDDKRITGRIELVKDFREKSLKSSQGQKNVARKGR